ncbi:cardiolipin synthase [Candidatus Mycoplasma mahonii]|uniref:cardiolipin synthase n=1 Tax=Candidatus Mycoplasma mahonii TaxID=3004105 RepID=UPI0026E98D26|nr:cardiolipin synthase [Candidatus Mycoplasma mahonii]WKX02516.1 cardiolipin synthase [Candidatus Mycoplasma mahonii]
MFIIGLSRPLLIILSFYLLTLIFNLLILIQNRHSEAKLSWIIVMTIFPVFGHIIFIIFGQRYKNRISKNDYYKKETFKLEKFNNKNDLIIQKKQSEISHRGIYSANIKIHRREQDIFNALFNDIKNANKFIHINYYILKPGEIYEHFKKILIKKAAQGVEIRFIVDDFGRWAMPWYEIKELEESGIRVAIFGKVYFPFIGSENGYRNHRKMVIIDGEKVHAGGINIADEYANLNKTYGVWLDYQSIITGEAVRSYSLLFIDDWQIVKKEKLDPKKYVLETTGGNSRNILVEDSPEINENIIEKSIVQWILNAEKSIKLTTPYFVPSHEIISALKTAAMSGVDITIYIPGKPDKKIVLIVSKYNASILSKYGIKFKETKDILIHSKIGVFDDCYAYFGTANIDLRSFYSQFEFLNLVSGPVIQEVNNLFEFYDKFAEDMVFKPINKFSLKGFLTRLAVFIFSPIM